MKAPQKRPVRRVPLVPGADRYTPFVLADVSAIKALADGTATPDQQKRAIRWIVEGAAMFYHVPMPGPDVEFNNGRRFVGGEIVKFLKLDMQELRTAASDGE